MYRLTALIASVILLLGTSAPAAVAVEPLPEDTFSLPCTSAVLMERESGTVLYSKNPYEHLSPASVTKEMTLLLVAEAVESGAVGAEDIVTAGARAASMGGSQIWLEEGERMTVAEMTKCVAVVSANDCSVALAEHLCGTEEAFARRMNERAAELGMENTHFTNCTGLFESDEHYSCAYDIAVLSRELLEHGFLRQFTSVWTDSIRDGAFGLTNTNKLVRSYPGCTGLKTGFTTRAMFCLAASAEREGTEFIAVILHADTSQDRFDSAKKLLDFAFANFTAAAPEVGEIPPVAVRLGKQGCVTVVCPASGRVLVRKTDRGSLTAGIDLPERVDAPVKAGERLGTLVVTAGGATVAEWPLVAGETVEAVGLGGLWMSLVRILCGQSREAVFGLPAGKT